MRKYPATLMRGGVCRGLIFREEFLPENTEEWDNIILQAIGGPDPKQMDGVGGGVSSNSKAVIISKPERPDVDLAYLSVQVVVGSTKVDYTSNCGNMSAAVAPYAIEEGLVEAKDPVTEVRMLNLNTQKIVVCCVPTPGGVLAQEGDFVLEGIDGTAPALELRFMDPAGAKTGALFPTGSPQEQLQIAGFGTIDVTILDVSNPMVLVRAEDVGLTGTELPETLEACSDASAFLEAIRCAAAVKLKIAKDLDDAYHNFSGVPKIGIFTTPKDYIDLSGRKIAAEDMDICVRIWSVRQPHKASPFTSANATAVAGVVSGTLLADSIQLAQKGVVRLGHPSGVMQLKLSVEEQAVNYVALETTARRIMDGTIYIKN